MYYKGILPGIVICTYGNNVIKVQIINSKKYNFNLEYTKKTYKLYYPIRINSFFQNFIHTKIEDYIEIVKCNICMKFNKNKVK